MLKDGKIVPAKDTIPFKDHKQISSIINYLTEVHGYKTLQPYFIQNLDSVLKNKDNNSYDYTKMNKIHALMNLTYIPDYQLQQEESAGRSNSFYSDRSNNIMSIKGYDYLISDFQVTRDLKLDTVCKSYLPGKNNLLICFDYKKKQLSLFAENEKDSALLFDINGLINSLEKEYQPSATVPAEKTTLISSNTSLNAKIIFDNINYQKKNQLIEQIGFDATIFVRKN